LTKKKALVVDNHPMILQFMTDLLEREGYLVRTAEDGLTALETLQSFIPEIVVVDLVMPNISGDTLCRIISRMPQLRHVPLIVLSAIAAEEEVNVTEFGATVCVAKGPLDKMAGHIRHVLKEIDQGNTEQLFGKTFGLKGVYVRKISEELLSSKRHAEAILKNLSEGILELTHNGKVIFANRAALELIGLPEDRLLARDFSALFDDRHRTRISKLLSEVSQGPQSVPEDRPVTLNDRYFTLSMFEVKEGSNRTIIVIHDDVTERLRMEAQLRRSREMEAILAGAVAHDLNNILGGIVGYPDILLLRLPAGSPLRNAVKKIQEAGNKAAAVVQDLLALGRCGHMPMEIMDLNDIVSTYLTSPEHERLAQRFPLVEIETNLCSAALSIEGSAVHLSKALMNLVFNAVEAVSGSGKVQIATGERQLREPIKGFETVPKGAYITLTISDTGVGMSNEDIDRIFEPFYSKKILGRTGTGLGMAVVRSTVKDHSGFIDVKSEVTKGTTFTLFLPPTNREPSGERPALTVEDYMGHGESILVVDDVEEQREIAKSMLEELGYRVEVADGGENAVEHLRSNKVDLVVLDMIMDPGIDGLETYRRIAEIHPGQRAVIVSGFSETDRVREAQRLGAGAYLRKPFMIKRLGYAVRQELDS
jgi:PAS domain S-box-containing protein